MFFKFPCKFLLFFIASSNAVFAQSPLLNVNTNFTLYSESFLGLDYRLRSSDNGLAEFNIDYNSNNSSFKLALNYDGLNNFTFDRSYLQFSSGSDFWRRCN